jgi:hypothetical protein
MNHSHEGRHKFGIPEKQKASSIVHWFQPSRTNVTTLQFEQDGDVVTADGDGFITVYSVDSDGAYFVRMEFEVTFH